MNLRLVMTGSDRDKLARLVNTHDAPFLGSVIRDLPPPGEGFVRFVADAIERNRPELAPVDLRGLDMAFARLGHRPVALERAISEALNPLSEAAGRFEGRVLALAHTQRTTTETHLEASWRGLAPLDRAIMGRLPGNAGSFRPFDAGSIRHYERLLDDEGEEPKRITHSRVQEALARLRAHGPPLLWKSNRGEYAVADAAVRQWHDERAGRGRWPP